MPYTVSCPLMNRNFAKDDKEKLVQTLKKTNVTRVFLALAPNCTREPLRGEELAALRENCAFLKARGFEVGAWFWAFYMTAENDYTYIVSPDGRTAKYTVCPLDPGYRAEMGAFVRDVSETGVDLIQFDDDYRFGFQDNGFGCVCGYHRAGIEKRLGRKVTDEELKTCLLSGGGNPVRDAFTDENGASLELFASDLRKYADAGNPNVRMGFCSCITSWDLDGAVPDRISRLLAGNTRPFYRLIGAPYWAPGKFWGNRLGDVIDLERAEAARRRDPEIEIYSEGDTYPRPRYATPASYLECFDTALRAAGCTDGILKYMLDYTADADYEPGYLAEAQRNAPLYAAIDSFFEGKTAVGVRVYDNPAKYRTLPIPARMANDTGVQDIAFSAAARFLTGLSVPAVFEGAGVCGVAFGEDARTLPEGALQKGLILDAAAAEILAAKGVDTGLMKRGEPIPAGVEIFADGKRAAMPGDPLFCPLELNPAAEIQSTAQADGKTYPISYTYTNAAGQRFLVFAYESVFASQSWFRCYLRQAQVNAFILSCGTAAPVYCPGHPEAWLLAKTDGTKTAIGVWNLFADPMRAPVLTLPAPAKRLRAFGCTAKAEGNKLTLSDIPAFSCGIVEVN